MKIKINTSMRYLAIACTLASYSIEASAEVYCSGYTIGFFNGVWNTRHQAAKGLAKLVQLKGTSLNGELGKRWEIFWEGLTGERTYFEMIFGIIPDIGNLVAQLYTDITTRVIGSFADLLSNPPTSADYAAHSSRLYTLAS